MASASAASNQRKPAWLRMKPPRPSEAESVLKTVQTFGLETVCREARCPNALDCHARGTATFMILGAICTRACRFCNVTTGRPEALDPTEPARLALAVQRLGLRHCVITSVDRDDLPDFGAAHFAACIRAVRHKNPDCTIEVLTPDFNGRLASIEEVVAARPDVFNHNLETVPRLSPGIRPKADYRQSLQILQLVKRLDPGVTTKSGIMVGLGERPDEVVPVLEDMRAHGVEILTIGQYLRPTPAMPPSPATSRRPSSPNGPKSPSTSALPTPSAALSYAVPSTPTRSSPRPTPPPSNSRRRFLTK